MTNIKKKIAVVNVLFPPKALGGATNIVVDEVSNLIERYGSDFEVVVFTTDVERRPVCELTVYPYNGYRVYALSAHINNWEYRDQEFAQIFDDFLALEQPDLVHFHCIQVLTGSVVEMTQKRNIPHLITVHDAWWISDYQFLFDKFGKAYPDGHPDPFEKFDLPDGVTIEQSLQRRGYLKGLLSKSDGVLAVSDTFRKIYEKNGVTNIKTNKNGISSEVVWLPKDTGHTEKVICAHVGGMSPHKGFDIFREAVMALNASNIEVLVVDHGKSEGYSSQTQWGKTKVTIIGLVSQNNIVDLYRRIDVLFAPAVCVESFGLTTREAAACGCWIVASDIGAVGDDVTADNGFRITPSADNLLSVLNQIDRSSSKYKGLSKSGKIRSSTDQVGELVKFINGALANNYERLNPLLSQGESPNL